MKTVTVEAISKALDAEKARSAWRRGVILYAFDLLEELASLAEYKKAPVSVTFENMLNGAPNWKEYSWGGSALIYDGQIAERLCAPWELRRTRCGELRPNRREEWLDTQARALYQAARLLQEIAAHIAEERSASNVLIAA